MRFQTAMEPGSALGTGAFAERSLCRRKPRDRDAERRARDVIEPDLVAECDRSRIAAMLAANAELESLAHFAAAFGGDGISSPTPSRSIDTNGSAGRMPFAV